MTTKFTASEIRAAREVCERATEGPWAICTAPDTNNRQAVCDHNFEYLARTDLVSIHSTEDCEANAAFIAHARTALPAALDEIERLKKLLAEAINELGAAARWIGSTQYRVDDETHKQFAAHIERHVTELRKESSDVE